MPVKTKEYSPFSRGSLVQSASDLYMAVGDEEGSIVPKGTVGLIVDRDFNHDGNNVLVEFLRGETWWVRLNEIEPYIR